MRTFKIILYTLLVSIFLKNCYLPPPPIGLKWIRPDETLPFDL